MTKDQMNRFRAAFRPMRDGSGSRYESKTGATYIVLKRSGRGDYVWCASAPRLLRISDRFFRTEEEALDDLMKYVFEIPE